jgi:hypothetical protein
MRTIMSRHRSLVTGELIDSLDNRFACLVLRFCSVRSSSPFLSCAIRELSATCMHSSMLTTPLRFVHSWRSLEVLRALPVEEAEQIPGSSTVTQHVGCTRHEPVTHDRPFFQQHAANGSSVQPYYARNLHSTISVLHRSRGHPARTFLPRRTPALAYRRSFFLHENFAAQRQ